MIQYRRTILLLAAGMVLGVGSSWADNKPAATTTPTAANAGTATAAKPSKTDSPTVVAMKAALALETDGKHDEAIAAYEKMGQLKSKKMECWRLNNEALSYIAESKQDQAVSLLELAVAADDTNYLAWNNLGTSYEATDQLDKAKDAYQKSIDTAKAANVSSAKAEGNLQDLQARMDKAAAKKNKGKKPAAAPAATPAAGGDQK